MKREGQEVVSIGFGFLIARKVCVCVEMGRGNECDSVSLRAAEHWRGEGREISGRRCVQHENSVKTDPLCVLQSSVARGCTSTLEGECATAQLMVTLVQQSTVSAVHNTEMNQMGTAQGTVM